MACVCALTLLVTASACGPDRGLRVEPASTASPTMLSQSNEDAGPKDTPFSLEQIRTTIEDSSGVAVTGRAAETAKVAGDCRDCLKFGAPFTRGDQKFQVVTVANPKRRSEDIAGVVISEKDGQPSSSSSPPATSSRSARGRTGPSSSRRRCTPTATRTAALPAGRCRYSASMTVGLNRVNASRD